LFCLQGASVVSRLVMTEQTLRGSKKEINEIVNGSKKGQSRISDLLVGEGGEIPIEPGDSWFSPK